MASPSPIRKRRTAALVVAGLVVLAGGTWLLQVRAARSAEAERARDDANFARDHGVPTETVFALERADKRAAEGDVDGAWAAFDDLRASPNANVRYEAYRSMASWARHPRFADRVRARIEEARRDPATKVRSAYPLLLVLSDAPNATERTSRLTDDPEEETRRMAQDALAWARQRGPGFR
jgi:hypothetical protein